MRIQQRVLDYYDHKYQRKFFDEIGILYEPYMSSPLRQVCLGYYMYMSTIFIVWVK